MNQTDLWAETKVTEHDMKKEDPAVDVDTTSNASSKKPAKQVVKKEIPVKTVVKSKPEPVKEEPTKVTAPPPKQKPAARKNTSPPPAKEIKKTPAATI